MGPAGWCCESSRYGSIRWRKLKKKSLRLCPFIKLFLSIVRSPREQQKRKSCLSLALILITIDGLPHWDESEEQKIINEKRFSSHVVCCISFFYYFGGFRRKLRQRERRLHKCEFEIWAIKILIILVELSWSVIFVDFFLISRIFFYFFFTFLIQFNFVHNSNMNFNGSPWTSMNFQSDEFQLTFFFSAAELPWNFWTRQRKLFNVNSNVNFSVSFHYSSRLSLGLIITKKKNLYLGTLFCVQKKYLYSNRKRILSRPRNGWMGELLNIFRYFYSITMRKSWNSFTFSNSFHFSTSNFSFLHTLQLQSAAQGKSGKRNERRFFQLSSIHEKEFILCFVR